MGTFPIGGSIFDAIAIPSIMRMEFLVF